MALVRYSLSSIVQEMNTDNIVTDAPSPNIFIFVSRYILFYLFEQPLLYIFLFGPELHGYGFWGGKDITSICARTTGVQVSHWENNRYLCETIVYRQFTGYITGFYAIIYFFVMATMYSIVISHVINCRCFICIATAVKRIWKRFYRGNQRQLQSCK